MRRRSSAFSSFMAHPKHAELMTLGAAILSLVGIILGMLISPIWWALDYTR